MTCSQCSRTAKRDGLCMAHYYSIPDNVKKDTEKKQYTLANMYHPTNLTGVEDQEFIITMKAMLQNMSVNDEKKKKQANIMIMFQYLAKNTCWMHMPKWKKFKRRVISKLLEFKKETHVSFFRDILVFFPARLCKYCGAISMTNQRVCQRHYVVELTLSRLVCQDMKQQILCYI